MRGAGHRDEVSGVLFTIGALSMVGIPIFAGFVPKLYFALAAFHMGWRTWVVLLALAVSTVLNVLYFLYAAILLWLPEQQERLPAGPARGGSRCRPRPRRRARYFEPAGRPAALRPDAVSAAGDGAVLQVTGKERHLCSI